MRKGQISNIKTFESKKIKEIKMQTNYINLVQTLNQTKSLDFNTFITRIGENNPVYKNLIIDFSLTNFVGNRKVTNGHYIKYIGNFHKFNISCLLCASFYLKESTLETSADMRNFVYVYFAFNLISCKYLDDGAIWNKSFISYWGITLAQALKLEIYALKHINYNMTIDILELENILKTAITFKKKPAFLLNPRK